MEKKEELKKSDYRHQTTNIGGNITAGGDIAFGEGARIVKIVHHSKSNKMGFRGFISLIAGLITIYTFSSYYIGTYIGTILSFIGIILILIYIVNKVIQKGANHT